MDFSTVQELCGEHCTALARTLANEHSRSESPPLEPKTATWSSTTEPGTSHLYENWEAELDAAMEAQTERHKGLETLRDLVGERCASQAAALPSIPRRAEATAPHLHPAAADDEADPRQSIETLRELCGADCARQAAALCGIPSEQGHEGVASPAVPTTWSRTLKAWVAARSQAALQGHGLPPTDRTDAAAKTPTGCSSAAGPSPSHETEQIASRVRPRSDEPASDEPELTPSSTKRTAVVTLDLASRWVIDECEGLSSQQVVQLNQLLGMECGGGGAPPQHPPPPPPRPPPPPEDFLERCEYAGRVSNRPAWHALVRRDEHRCYAAHMLLSTMTPTPVITVYLVKTMADTLRVFVHLGTDVLDEPDEAGFLRIQEGYQRLLDDKIIAGASRAVAAALMARGRVRLGMLESWARCDDDHYQFWARVHLPLLSVEEARELPCAPYYCFERTIQKKDHDASTRQKTEWKTVRTVAVTGTLHGLRLCRITEQAGVRFPMIDVQGGHNETDPTPKPRGDLRSPPLDAAFNTTGQLACTELLGNPAMKGTIASGKGPIQAASAYAAAHATPLPCVDGVPDQQRLHFTARSLQLIGEGHGAAAPRLRPDVCTKAETTPYVALLHGSLHVVAPSVHVSKGTGTGDCQTAPQIYGIETWLRGGSNPGLPAARLTPVAHESSVRAPCVSRFFRELGGLPPLLKDGWSEEACPYVMITRYKDAAMEATRLLQLDRGGLCYLAPTSKGGGPKGTKNISDALTGRELSESHRQSIGAATSRARSDQRQAPQHGSSEKGRKTAAKGGRVLWTNAMVNTVAPSIRALTGPDDDFAYVYENYGNVPGFHARHGGGSTIGRPCKTAEEAALIIAGHLESLGWVPPSAAAVAQYKQELARRRTLLTQYRPSPQAELLTLKLNPTTGSGYKYVSHRPDEPKLVACGKTYSATLPGYVAKSFETGPEAAWYVAYCCKYGTEPTYGSDDD